MGGGPVHRPRRTEGLRANIYMPASIVEELQEMSQHEVHNARVARDDWPLALSSPLFYLRERVCPPGTRNRGKTTRTREQPTVRMGHAVDVTSLRRDDRRALTRI